VGAGTVTASAPGHPAADRGATSASIAAFAGYAALAFLFFGVRPLLESGHQYIGLPDDPQIPIWSFAWWLHSIEHAGNPLVTHAVWAPSGVDLVWVNTVAPLAVVFAPLTALAGPVAAYDVAAVLLPAVAAWAAYLLCRHLTGRLWPSLVGGYLFGFSSYVLGHVLGQPQLTAVFVIPLVALVLLRGLEGELGPGGLTVRLGLLLGLQIYLATEIAFTLTVVIAIALLLAFLLAPRSRPALRRLLAPIALAYLIAAVIAAPVLYFALTDLRTAGYQPPAAYTADLLNFLLPTHLEAVGAGWAHAVARRFPGNTTEQGAFLGLPLLVMVALYARRSWRTAAGRFLLAALVLAAYLSLGPELHVDGRRVIPLPTPFGHQSVTLPGAGTHLLPLFDNVLPVRFSVYASLAAAVIVAVWIASTRSGVLRFLLPALTVLLLVPNPGAGVWTTTYSIPSFFTSSAFRHCLAKNEIVLPEPVGQGGLANLWQVASDFRFRMAGGRLQTSPPSAFLHPSGIAQISVGYPPVPNQAQLLEAYFAAKGVTAVVVDKRQAAIWAPALNRIARPLRVGGVLLYRVGHRASGGC